ncbi:MAG: N-(5'-phosphoribosyl)anthranilate isomerase [Rhodobacteraceae bacterium]|nr:N-(5'-phosphoribosyl)anthranilate isomerase [Paracoccaceae bacterium]
MQQVFRPPLPQQPPPLGRNTAWLNALFAAKSAQDGGVIRRSVRSIEREIGRETFEAEVRRRGFHAIEIGGQYIILCNSGQMRVIC